MQDQFTARYSSYHGQIFVCIEPNRIIGTGIQNAIALREELDRAITQARGGAK